MSNGSFSKKTKWWHKRPSNNEAGGNQWLFGFLAGFIGGILAVAIAILFTPFLDGTMKSVSSDAASGFAATVFGGLAALLGVAISVVVATFWIFLERRVAMALKKPVQQMHEKIGKDISSASRATSDALIAMTNDRLSPSEKDWFMERAIKKWPHLFNVVGEFAMQNAGKAEEFSLVDPRRKVLIDLAAKWADKALQMPKEDHNPGYPQFVKACVLDLQKEPYSAMDFLRKAIKNGYLPQWIQDDWLIVTGMTHGGPEAEDLLKKLLEILGLSLPTREEVKKHCENKDSMEHASFDVVRRDNGDAETVTVEGIRPDRDDPKITWQLLVSQSKLPQPIGKSADGSVPADFLLKQYVPTRIKPN